MAAEEALRYDTRNTSFANTHHNKKIATPAKGVNFASRWPRSVLGGHPRPQKKFTRIYEHTPRVAPQVDIERRTGVPLRRLGHNLESEELNLLNVY